MAGTRAPFASLAALAAVASAQGEQPGTDAAQSARRDLQSLPTVQRPVEATSGKSLFSGTSSVTGLSIGTSSVPGASQKSRDEALPGKSANWLLDGVSQLEAETKAQRDATDAAGKRGGNDNLQLSATGERPLTTSVTNPFTEYLTQWLSPGDQALLNASNRSAASLSTSTAPWETPRSEFRRETALAPATANPLQMELPGLADFPANRTAQNPYLTEPFQVERAPGAPLAGPASGGRETSGVLPSILTPTQSTLPPVAPASVEQARPVPAAAPTDRLIDDRKYFPQLRRF